MRGTMKNVTIETVLGRCMTDADFQEKIFSNPEGIGRKIGLTESDIDVLKNVDQKAFFEFREKLDSQFTRSPVTTIFCIPPDIST
jgi:hypothetical protein